MHWYVGPGKGSRHVEIVKAARRAFCDRSLHLDVCEHIAFRDGFDRYLR